jgi:hypothetical protein
MAELRSEMRSLVHEQVGAVVSVLNRNLVVMCGTLVAGMGLAAAVT